MDCLERIRTLLEEWGWSVYRLAQEAGVPQSTLANLFLRNNMPTVPTLERICQALGITMAEFFSQQPTLPPEEELTAQLLEAFQRRAPLYLRINPLRATAEGLAASLGRQDFSLKPVESLPWAAVAEGEGSPASLEEFQEGLFHVQDLSAQLACSLLEARPGQAVCDCCAAPGGKSFTLAEDMENTGSLHAFDLYKGRVGLIQQGAERLRLSCIQAGRKDASKPYEGLEPMDRVLCDVPCSGYGVIRRKPEIRYKPLATVRELPRLQYAILENGAALVKPGGLLLYATCTLNPAENGAVASRFLQEHLEFEPAPFRLPGVTRLVEEPPHTITLLPVNGGSDGFYAARFRRKGDL